MTLDEFVQILTEECGTAEFWYKDEKCMVKSETKNFITTYHIWYKNVWNDYETVSELLADRLFDGWSLNDIFSSLEIERHSPFSATLRACEGKTVRLVDDEGEIYEGYVSMYIFAEDNVPEEVESLVLSEPTRLSDGYQYEALVEFTAAVIRSVEIID